MRYSALTNGFYPDAINYPNLPSDVVVISEESHAELMQAQTLGQRIGVVNGFPVAQDFPSPSIEAVRAGMRCTALQGKLAIGEAVWSQVLVYRSTAPWAQQMTIDSAADWNRTSQDIQFIGYLLNFTDLEMDALFRVAVTL